MDTDLKITDLEHATGSVRFFWTIDRPDIGVHTFDANGNTLTSEALDRTSARARWAQLIRAGYTLRQRRP